jgi:hypothetical protein
MNYGCLLTDANIEALRTAIGMYAGLVYVPAPLIRLAKTLREPVEVSIASPRFAIVLATPPTDVVRGLKSHQRRHLIVEGQWSDTPKHYIDFWTLSVTLDASGFAAYAATVVGIEPGLAVTAVSVIEVRSAMEDESVWSDVGIVLHGGMGRRFAFGPHSTLGLELFPSEAQIDELIERYPVRVRVEA